MSFSLQNPAFFAYAAASLVLCLNLIVLWIYSGLTRRKTGTAINPEDCKDRIPLSQTDPPEVARVLRAHRNAEATIYPFLVLGLVFVACGGSGATAEIIFGLFAAARLLHSVAYVKGRQPWRSVGFAASLIALIALMVCIVLRLIHPA